MPENVETEASCPSCGFDRARVRVRGNAFAATCLRCRRTDVMPLLSEADLLAVDGELDEIAPVVEIGTLQLRRRVELARVATLPVELQPAVMSVEFRLPVQP